MLAISSDKGTMIWECIRYVSDARLMRGEKRKLLQRSVMLSNDFIRSCLQHVRTGTPKDPCTVEIVHVNQMVRLRLPHNVQQNFGVADDGIAEYC